MDLQLNGKTALVFGGSRGLGKAIAAELTNEGVTVVIVARDAERVQRTAAETGCLALPGDLAVPGAGGELVQQAAQHGPVAATPSSPTPADRQPAVSKPPPLPTGPPGFRACWLATVEAIQAALPAMQANHWGRILAITSVRGQEPQPGLVISNGSRRRTLGPVEQPRRAKWRRRYHRWNALLPRLHRYRPMASLRDNATMGPKIPAGRLGEPAEFAALATFLASGRASYITGQAIAVDGGLLQSI